MQPSTTVAGNTITPAVVVEAQDPLGNIDLSFVGLVTILIGDNPAGGLLSGTNVQTATSGVVSFNDLSIDKAGSGYTLMASAGPLTAAVSAAFDIVAGAATQLAFTVQPSNTTAGNSITPAVEVTAQDAFGNTDVNFAGTVTIAISINPGGGTLSGTTVQSVSLGVAQFSDLSIDKAGIGYALVASSSGLTAAAGPNGRAALASSALPPPETSALFNISAGAAVDLVFIIQPSNTAAGVTMSPVQVAAVDAFGNVAVTFLGNITLAIASNPTGGVLSGTLIVSAVAGISTFSNLSINSAGTGYQLGASSPGLTGETSVPFDIF